MGLVGIIPAAGKGTRVSPLPGSKELFPIGYQERQGETGPYLHPKVVMQYLIDSLILAGVRRFFIIIGDNKWDIVRYYGSGEKLDISISYLFQERLTGMPGAIDLVRPWLQEEDIMLFGMPDTIFTPPDAFLRLLEHHRQTCADVCLGLFETDTPELFGMTRVDENGFLTAFVDKPQHTDLIYMWGIGCWGITFARLLGEASSKNSTLGEPVLSDLFALALQRGLKVTGLAFPESRYLDIGTPADLVLASRLFAQIPPHPDGKPSRER
jgi:glucose-1-phosphate thymidylyltransferase